MRTKTYLLVLLVAAAGMAGCMGDGDGEEASTQSASEQEPSTQANLSDPEETVEETGPTITSTWQNSSWEGASAAFFYYCVPPVGQDCANEMAFSLPGNVTALVGELAWEGDAQMYFQVLDGEGNVVDSTSGSSPLSITVFDELPESSAEWQLEAWVDSATPAQVDATFVASVVEDGELPNGFSRVQ